MADVDLIKTPLLKMPVEDQAKVWHGRVKLARKYLNAVGNQTEVPGGRRWDNNVKAMAGDFNSPEELGPEAIDVNIVRPNSKIVVGPLTLSEPFVAVNPTKEQTNDGGDNVRFAEVTEIEVNYWLRELDVKRVGTKCALDAFSTNHGYAYIGRVDAKEDGYDSEDGIRTENEPQIRHKQPFVRRLSPKHVLVPPGYWDLEEAPWVALVFLRPLRHVVQKFNVDPTDITWKSSFAVDTDDEDMRANTQFKEYMESDDVRMVRVLNIWDKETRKVWVMAEGDDKFLEDPKDWPWETEGFPLAHLRFEDVQDEFHGTPLQTYGMPQQKELNASRTSVRKRFNRAKADRFVTDEIPESTVENWQRSEDGQYHRVPVPSGQNIGQMIHTDPGLPTDRVGLEYGAVVQADATAIYGVSNEQKGAGDPNVDSATASANIQNNVQLRNSERGDAMSSFYVTIAKKLWMIVRAFPNQKVTRRIAGDRPNMFSTVTYTTAELRGEFEFSMNFSAMMQDVPATRATRAMLMYKMLRGDPLVNPNALLLDVFRTQNYKFPENYLLALRSPQEELGLMIQNMPVEAHERDDHKRHLEEHEADSIKIAQKIEQFAQQVPPDSPELEQLRATQVLLTAHAQDHIAKYMRISGQKQQGSQGANANGMRADMKQAAGEETAAELSGQPLVGVGGLVS